MSDTKTKPCLDLRKIQMEGDMIKDTFSDQIRSKGLADTITTFFEQYNTQQLKDLVQDLSEKFGEVPHDAAGAIGAMEEQLEDLALYVENESDGSLVKMQAAVKMGVYIARVRALQELH